MEDGSVLRTFELPGPCSAVGVDVAQSRMACCCPDGLVTIYSAINGEWKHDSSCTLPDGAALQAIWSSPEFGAVLAVLSDTGSVTVWREDVLHRMHLVLSITDLNLTCITFGPKQLGQQLAAADHDGRVRIYEAAGSRVEDAWVLQSDFQACRSSAVSSICWRTYSAGLPSMLAVGTAQGALVFFNNMRCMSWELAATLGEGSVQDVKWASSATSPAADILAVAGSHEVVLYELEGAIDRLQVKEVARLAHEAQVSQVEWSTIGTWLAVALEDGHANLWRPNLAGEWTLQSQIKGQEHDSDYVMIN